ncbi:MAG: BMP family ABC transporter substrate-binding protein [Clostridiales bacterium]|nr:BMP family ABC transporter substrate-binding protein [Clostridiales bacterium]
MKNITKVLVVLMLLVLVVSVAGCSSKTAEVVDDAVIADEVVKVGMIYIGPPGDAGWTYAHDQGRQFLEEQYPNVEVLFVESVPESSDAERVMTELVEEGCTVVFATSFGYMDYMDNVALKYPDVKFFHCSGYKTEENMSTYFGRIYQARYLTGMIAGAMTETNEIGYVAAHPIPEVIRGINAFTLGVKEANADAVVKVVWTNTWYDPAKEKEAAQGLLDSGVDVIAQHQDTPGPQQAAEEAGVYAVGYNTNMRAFAPEANLTSAVWNWGPYYVNAVKSVIDGTFVSTQYWGGLEDGIVDIAPISDKVPADMVAQVEAKKAAIIDGSFDVFAGPIKDQDGNIKVAEGSSMTDGELLSMDWFVEGVEGVIPK